VNSERIALVCALAALTAGCAPTSRYYTDKTPEAPPPPRGKDTGACSMATPATRLNTRGSSQRSVDGFGSFPCATPSSPGAR